MREVRDMKKSNVWVALAYILVGAVFLVLAGLTETKLDGIFAGMAGAGIGPGGLMLWQYLHYRKPEHAKGYEEKLARKRIEQNDEFKEMLRGKSAQYLHRLNLLVTCFAMLVFSVLDSLELVAGGWLITVYLGGYLVLQLVAGAVIFNRLLKKYAGE